MSALQLLQYVTDAIFVVIAIIVVIQAARRPDPVRIDIALFFTALALIVAETLLTALLGIPPTAVVADVVVALLLGMPYLLLRLVDDFSRVRAPLKRAAEIGYVVSVGAFVLVPPPVPPELTFAILLYFFVIAAYCAVAFVRFAARSTGVTRRRMQAVAEGTFLIGAVVLVAGLTPLLPGAGGFLNGLVQIGSLLSGVAYYVGFAPPRLLVRAWQEPELRGFLERAATLPRLRDTGMIVRTLEDGAARTMGAGASIGLWDADKGVLRFANPHGVLPSEVGESDFLAWRVFAEQKAAFFRDPAAEHPSHAAEYRRHDVAATLIAPITAGRERLGILEVFTAQRPIFSEDDLELVRLMADQAAVILESRSLIDEASRVRAHEEAARLKDDFLSAAAHDLKTPLTTLVAQAQFLERRAATAPSAPPDVDGIRRIVREAKRLSTLVTELLDASRLERGALVGERESVDLVALAREVADRESYRTHNVLVSADAPVIGVYDSRRIGQVIENLIENAVKYSPTSSDVRVMVVHRDGESLIDVSDDGIGIPRDDLPHVFERFHRASNVDDRRFSGMGLGLFICKGIVEQHSGRIWVESILGAGTTFHVALPAEGHA